MRVLHLYSPACSTMLGTIWLPLETQTARLAQNPLLHVDRGFIVIILLFSEFASYLLVFKNVNILFILNFRRKVEKVSLGDRSNHCLV